MTIMPSFEQLEAVLTRIKTEQNCEGISEEENNDLNEEAGRVLGSMRELYPKEFVKLRDEMRENLVSKINNIVTLE